MDPTTGTMNIELPKYTDMSKDIGPFLRRMTILLDSQNLDDARKQAMLKIQLPDACLDFLEGKEFANYNALVNSLKEKYNGQISKTTAQSRLLSFQFEFKDVEKEILKFAELVKCASSVTDEDELFNWQLDRLTIQLGEKNRIARERLMNCRKDYKSIQEAAADIACSINMHHNSAKNDHKKQRSESNSCSYCKKKGHSYDDCRKRLNLCLKCGEKGHKVNECKKNVTMVTLKEKKVEDKSDFFIVKAMINGYCFNGLIDSGSDSTIVPKCIAKEFVNVDELPAVEIVTAGKRTLMKRFSGSACIELEGFQTAIDELLISDEKYQQFDGIIGLNVLKNLNIVIDLENKELLPKDKSKFKHVFHCQVKNTELSEMERNFKIHLKEELPDLNPKSDFDCGKGIDVAPEQMMINVKPLGIKYYSAPTSKDIQANIDEMLKYNIISRSQVVEVSPFYPIIKFDKESNAPKKFYDENGSEFTRMRVLLDAREVNNRTVKISYQPNTAFRIIQHLREFSYASVLDLHQAFFQVKLHPNNYNMFSFTYNRQTYSYNRLPQGAVNSPIIFQRTMELVLEEFCKNCDDKNMQVEVYQDDIILLTSLEKDHHLKILKMLLCKLNECNVKLSIDKSKFLQTSVNYLSWTFERNIVRPSDVSILKLTKRKFPEKKFQLYQFLQSLCYFKITIKDWDLMTRDLYISCKGDKNDKIIWSDANKMKFDELIKALLGKPYLHLRKDDLPLIMVVDASSIAVGGYIYQQQDSERLILGHFCCILGKCLKARSPTYLELKAISVGVETFKDLVCGKTLYVHSDHRPLESLLNSKSITQPKHMELLCTIKQYVTEIIYIPGSQNCIADYISRCTSANEGGSNKILKEINFIHESCNGKDELTEMIKNDQINLETYDVKLNDIKYVTVKKDNDLQEERLVIPIVGDKLAWHIIKSVHDKYGHIVGRKLTEVVERKYKIKGLKVKVEKFINQCLTCQKTMEKNLFRPELETIQYPENVWEIVATDICVVAQHGKIIQFIDTLSRYWVPIVIENLSSEETCNIAIREIFSRYGNPQKIICDQGTNYKGFEFQTLCESMGIELHFCTADHKTGNAICERSFKTMRTILMKLKIIADENATFNFKDAVSYASFIYNSTECTTTKQTPFLLMFGRHPNVSDFVNIGYQNSSTIDKLKELRKVAQVTSQCIREHQNEMINMTRESHDIKIGDQVLVKSNTSTKIDCPFDGPYQVKDIKGNKLSLVKPGKSRRGRPLVRDVAQCKPYSVSNGEE